MRKLGEIGGVEAEREGIMGELIGVGGLGGVG